MRTLRVKARVTFYADFPDDDGEADERADELTDAITDALDANPLVIRGSVSVPYLDTVPE